jgi:hypothetical protein
MSRFDPNVPVSDSIHTHIPGGRSRKEGHWWEASVPCPERCTATLPPTANPQSAPLSRRRRRGFQLISFQPYCLAGPCQGYRSGNPPRREQLAGWKPRVGHKPLDRRLISTNLDVQSALCHQQLFATSRPAIGWRHRVESVWPAGLRRGLQVRIIQSRRGPAGHTHPGGPHCYSAGFFPAAGASSAAGFSPPAGASPTAGFSFASGVSASAGCALSDWMKPRIFSRWAATISSGP